MAWAFDHDLDVKVPGAAAEFADGFEFGELGGVVGVGDGAGAQAVAKRECDVVLGEDLAELVEVFVQEGFLVVGEAPASHDRTAARDDAGHTLGGQRNVRQAYAGVDGHVVHALLALLDDGVAEDLPGQVFGDAIDLLQRLVDGHSADGHGGVAQNPLAGGVDVIAGG